jgi:hypothetical protein
MPSRQQGQRSKQEEETESLHWVGETDRDNPETCLVVDKKWANVGDEGPNQRSPAGREVRQTAPEFDSP